MLEKRYKEAFERASEERQELILETGIEEFSSKGYEKANINVIAKKCGISIGLMYKYFSTKEDANYIKLYNEIGAIKNKAMVNILATAIEESTSQKYIKSITQALENGDVRSDLDPKLFAFFLDNLLTTLQFSYTCDYYRKRFEIYTGIDVNKMDDEQVVSQLLSFIESAFTYEKKKQR